MSHSSRKCVRTNSRTSKFTIVSVIRKMENVEKANITYNILMIKSIHHSFIQNIQLFYFGSATYKKKVFRIKTWQHFQKAAAAH